MRAWLEAPEVCSFDGGEPAMKLCAQCHHTPWPYLFALFISGFTAFLTWFTLAYSHFDATERLLGSIGIFLAADATLTHYMMACMKRHCRHQDRGFSHRQRPLST
jgi:hypothetical protein